MNNYATIKSFCTFLNGGTPPTKNPKYYEGNIPWISSADILDGFVGKPRNYITKQAVLDSTTTLVPKGTVLLVTRIGVGKVTVAPFDLCFSQDITAIVPNKDMEILPEYLAFFLQKNRESIRSQQRGATIQGVTREAFVNLEIPLIDKVSQLKIIDELNLAIQLKKKRQQSLAYVEQYMESLFIEYFGDPISNSKKWPLKSFGEIVGQIESGWSPQCESRPAETNEIGVLKLGSVTWCDYDQNENKAFLKEEQFDASIEVRNGDLLFCRKNTLDLVGGTAFVFSTRPRLMMPDLIFRINPLPDSEVDPIYFWKLLINSNFKKKVQSLASGSAGSMPNISKERLKNLMIPVPQIQHQLDFRKKIEAAYLLKQSLINSQERMEMLFSSLLDEAIIKKKPEETQNS